MICRRAQKSLADAGLSVWTDANLTPGTPEWEWAITQAIKDCSGFVVLMSPDSYKSEWVLREITAAQERGKRIFPILMAGSEDDAVPLRLNTFLGFNEQYESEQEYYDEETDYFDEDNEDEDIDANYPKSPSSPGGLANRLEGGGLGQSKNSTFSKNPFATNPIKRSKSNKQQKTLNSLDYRKAPALQAAANPSL